MNNRTYQVLATVSLFLFGIAMVVPALTFEKLCGGGYTPSGLFGEPTGAVEAWRGIQILLLGIVGVIFAPHLSFGWFANVFYTAALILLWVDKPRIALPLAIAGLAIGIGGTLWTQTHGLYADEGGVCYFYLTNLNEGFWLWVGAQSLVAVVALGRSLLPQRQPT